MYNEATINPNTKRPRPRPKTGSTRPTAEGGWRRRMRGRMREAAVGCTVDPAGHRRGGRMRRGEIRTALAGRTRRRARPRLRGDAAARGAQRRHLAAEPRLRLPHPAAVAGRRARHLDRAGRQARLRDHRSGPDRSDPPDRGRSPVLRRGRQGVVRVRAAARKRGGHLAGSRQIAKSGNEAQIQQATEIVRDARKQLYQILGED